jgi:hypothetical protein
MNEHSGKKRKKCNAEHAEHAKHNAKNARLSPITINECSAGVKLFVPGGVFSMGITKKTVRFDPTDSFYQVSHRTEILFGPKGSALLNHLCFHIANKIPDYTKEINGQVWVTQTYAEMAEFLGTTRQTICQKIKALREFDLLETTKISGFTGLAFRFKKDIQLKLNEIMAGVKRTSSRKKIKEIMEEVWTIFKGWLLRKASKTATLEGEAVQVTLTPRSSEVNATPYIYMEKGENPPFLYLSPEDVAGSNTESIASPRGTLSIPEPHDLHCETAEQPTSREMGTNPRALGTNPRALSSQQQSSQQVDTSSHMAFIPPNYVPEPVFDDSTKHKSGKSWAEWNRDIDNAPNSTMGDMLRRFRDGAYPDGEPQTEDSNLVCISTVEIKAVGEKSDLGITNPTQNTREKKIEPVFEPSQEDFAERWKHAQQKHAAKMAVVDDIKRVTEEYKLKKYGMAIMARCLKTKPMGV